jgi:hypothetical protein
MGHRRRVAAHSVARLNQRIDTRLVHRSCGAERLPGCRRRPGGRRQRNYEHFFTCQNSIGSVSVRFTVTVMAWRSEPAQEAAPQHPTSGNLYLHARGHRPGGDPGAHRPNGALEARRPTEDAGPPALKLLSDAPSDKAMFRETLLQREPGSHRYFARLSFLTRD